MEVFEILMYVLMGVFLFSIVLALIVSVLRDRKMSKEWDRIFKGRNRDD